MSMCVYVHSPLSISGSGKEKRKRLREGVYRYSHFAAHSEASDYNTYRTVTTRTGSCCTVANVRDHPVGAPTMRTTTVRFRHSRDHSFVMQQKELTTSLRPAHHFRNDEWHLVPAVPALPPHSGGHKTVSWRAVFLVFRLGDVQVGYLIWTRSVVGKAALALHCG